MPRDTIAGVDRRQFLQAAVAGVAAGLVAPAAPWWSAARGLTTRAALTPDEALQELMTGNRRFVASRSTTMDVDVALLKKRTADKQEPFAAVLTCADSRIPVELIFDQTIGHIFVTRVAGNVATPEIIGSLEYAVAALGVKTVLVLGHSNCGAVKAAMKADTVPGQISTLYRSLRQGVEQSGGDFTRAIGANAKVQADLLRTTSTVIRDALQAKTVTVSSGVYNLATGVVALS